MHSTSHLSVVVVLFINTRSAVVSRKGFSDNHTCSTCEAHIKLSSCTCNVGVSLKLFSLKKIHSLIDSPVLNRQVWRFTQSTCTWQLPSVFYEALFWVRQNKPVLSCQHSLGCQKTLLSLGCHRQVHSDITPPRVHPHFKCQVELNWPLLSSFLEF